MCPPTRLSTTRTSKSVVEQQIDHVTADETRATRHDCAWHGQAAFEFLERAHVVEAVVAELNWGCCVTECATEVSHGLFNRMLRRKVEYLFYLVGIDVVGRDCHRSGL